MKRILFAGILSAAAVLSAAPAGADPWNPPCTITPEQSCSHNGTPPGQLKFCPETGGWIERVLGIVPKFVATARIRLADYSRTGAPMTDHGMMLSSIEPVAV